MAGYTAEDRTSNHHSIVYESAPTRRFYALARQALAVTLAVLLALGMVPTTLWAEGIEDAVGTGAEPVGQDVQQRNSASQNAGEEASGEEHISEEGVSEERAAESAPGGQMPDSQTPGGTASTESASNASAPNSSAPGNQTPDSHTTAEGETDNPATLSATIEIIGIDGEGTREIWFEETSFALPEGSTAADLTEVAFEQAEMTADYDPNGTNGWNPETITSPFDPDLTLGYDPQTGNYWQLFHNGAPAELGAGSIGLAPGDSVVWYYSAYGAELPSGEVEVNPDAEHPALDAEWEGFANGGAGATTDAATPVDGAEDGWSHTLLTEEERAAGASATASDALIISGKIYIVSASSTYDPVTWAPTKSLARLEVVDPATGSVERRIELNGALDSICRPVYADGIIVIPLAGGALQAVSASTLETIWVLAGIDGAQALSSLTVSDGYVYAATADTLDASYSATSGTVRRVDLYTGEIAGQPYHSEASGHYWAGGTMVNGCYVIGNDAGEVLAFAADLSCVVANIKLSSSVRSTLVEADGFVYAVTSDGVLHKLSMAQDGTFTEVASVKFGSSSTSTPTVANGLVFVGGSSVEGYENDWGSTSYYGVLAVIDADTMELVHSVEAFDGGKLPGDVKSAPLVSEQATGTYAYFTCNALPGGVYCYRLGDASATLLFTPDATQQNYAMSSVFAGADGTLYYTNDSGNLFALHAGTGGSGQGGSGGSGQGGSGGAGGKPSVGSGAGGAGGGTVAPGARPLGSGASAGAEHAAASTALAEEAAGEPVETRVGAGVDTAVTAASPVNTWAVGGIAAGVAGLVIVGLYMALGKPRGEA